MPSLRFWIWIVCTLLTVFISRQTELIFYLGRILDFVFVPAWVYLLPITLTLSWGISKVIQVQLDRYKLSTEGKAVFISGCDSGFGHHLALQLSEKGFHVFAGCLFPDGEGAAKLAKVSRKSRVISVVPCDVTSEESLEKAVKYVSANIGGNVLWAVVANAGILTPGYIEWVSMSKVKKMFDVNIFGVMNTVRAFVPFLRVSNGRVVITTSWAARFAPPTLVPYAMTKHALLGYCEGLRAELSVFNIAVSSIEPNMYKTSIIPYTNTEINQQWESLTDEQQTAYGEQQLHRGQQFLGNFADLCQSDLSGPLAAFEHAIIAKYPKPSYQIDRFPTLLLSKLMLYLPEQFKDMFVQNNDWLLRLAKHIMK